MKKLKTNVNQKITMLAGTCTGVCKNCSSARFGARVPVICDQDKRFAEWRNNGYYRVTKKIN